MAYSKSLAERVRHLIGRQRGLTEKRMFGGIGFLLYGNLVVAVWLDSLIVRLGIEAANEAMEEPYVKPFDLTGKAMKGWAMIEADGVDCDHQLESWIQRAVAFVRTLDPKME